MQCANGSGGTELEADKPKRVRRDPETARTSILDMTERLMVEEGYAAVSTRRIAQELGLNAATIHYYYPTTDDLFIAVHRRMTERQIVELETVLASESPLDALWTFQSGWSQSALGVEFIGLSNHRKTIRTMLAAAANDARDLQAQALERAAGPSHFDQDILPPIALVTLSVALARTLANEKRVGITRGHKEVRHFIDWALAQLVKPTANR